MKSKSLRVVFSLFLALLTVNCASSLSSHLQSAQFALDQNEYSTAISEALDALSADPGNVQASRILASAYFGRSGLDFLDIAVGVIDLNTSSLTNFQQVADILPETATPLDDLRAAIATLEAIPGIDATTLEEDIADAAFDLGMMQIIEHFAIGVYESNYFTSFDVAGIDDANRTNVLEDLLNFDNRLISSGVASDESFIQEVRQTVCIIEPISVDSTEGEGFTTAEFRDLVGCELATDSATYVTTTVANCAALDPDTQSADVQACYTADTETTPL